MKHRFKHICPNPKKLLEGCNKLSTFMGRIEKLQNDKAWTSGGWKPEEFKGDAFEALVEVLIMYSPIDKRINIVNYLPHSLKLHGADMGIDGFGVSHNGSLHTVQIKYRSNTQSVLTANEDHISNFVAKTRTHPLYKEADMTIFTTAKGLNQKILTEMYHDDKIRVMGYAEISKLIDNNPAFWDAFRLEMGV